MAIIVDGCEASVIMPYKYKWVQKYKREGWFTNKEYIKSCRKRLSKVQLELIHELGC